MAAASLQQGAFDAGVPELVVSGSFVVVGQDLVGVGARGRGPLAVGLEPRTDHVRCDLGQGGVTEGRHQVTLERGPVAGACRRPQVVTAG